MNLYEELEARGLIHQVTDPFLRQYLNENKVTVYSGIDPTSDSLHVGNLLGLVTLRRFQRAGHRVIAVVGGATGMIGDPSGKNQERLLLNAQQIEKNVEGISRVISRFIDFEENASSRTLLINNFNWFKEITVVEFLRDVGKHFTVNYMLAKESVQSRIEDREHGLSYTEFSYMILQAYDFYILNKENGCNLQVGGSDQWGNITAGIELIRRKNAHQDLEKTPAFGFTWPLVTKADGTKFGKSESGSIWLSEDKTSPYQFYQFFLRTPDQDVIKYLRYFTFLSLEEIQSLENLLKSAPEKRDAQTALAKELTVLVHGEDEFRKVQAASSSLFNGDITELDIQTLNELISNAPSTAKFKKDLELSISIVDLLVETKLVNSKGQARQDIQGGGIYLNNQRVTDATLKVGVIHLVHEKYIFLRKGKKNYHSIIFS